MYPILAEFDSFTLHTYGLLCAVGFLTLGGVMLTLAHRAGLKMTHIMDVLLIGSLMGVIGARGVFLLQNPDHFDGVWEILNLQQGGLVFYGAVLCGLPAAVLVMKLRKLPIYQTLDFVEVGAPFGHAIARLGCFSAGSCYGLHSEVSWAVTYTHAEAVAPLGIALHPAQVYESLSLIFIGICTAFVYTRRTWKGQAMLTYMGLYAVARFALEGFRGDDQRGLFMESWLGSWLSFSQGLSLGLLWIAIGVFYFGARRAQGLNAR